MVKFNILVPAYKAEYLHECIGSVLAQTYPDWELIIVNDASPQDLDSIVQSYSDPRIQYYKNEVGYGAVNMVGNWNECLKHATGEYVMCVGDDDMLFENCLADYAELIKKYPNLDVFHTKTVIINEKSEITEVMPPAPEWESAYSLMWHSWNGRFSRLGEYCYRTEALKNLEGFHNFLLGWHSDYVTAFEVAKEKGIAHIQGEPGFKFRMSSQHVSSNGYYEEKIKSWIEVEKWYKDFLAEVPSNEKDKLYHKEISEFIDSRLYNERKIELIHDMKKHPSRLFYWLRNGKQYGLNAHLILSAFKKVI